MEDQACFLCVASFFVSFKSALNPEGYISPEVYGPIVSKSDVEPENIRGGCVETS